jgi:hypothetical protein
MRRVFVNFSRTHLFIFLGFYIVFAALTALVLNLQSESDRREAPIVSATLASISGPFTGAIARQFQSCCWDFSLTIFPYSAAFLGFGVLAQIVAMPWKCCERATRLTAWCLGLLGWFGGVLLSFAHALT